MLGESWGYWGYFLGEIGGRILSVNTGSVLSFLPINKVAGN